MRNRDRERFEKARGVAGENLHCHAVHGNARSLVNARACATGSSDGSRRRMFRPGRDVECSGRVATSRDRLARVAPSMAAYGKIPRRPPTAGAGRTRPNRRRSQSDPKSPSAPRASGRSQAISGLQPTSGWQCLRGARQVMARSRCRVPYRRFGRSRAFRRKISARSSLNCLRVSARSTARPITGGIQRSGMKRA
jgi:hypothetical protein